MEKQTATDNTGILKISEQEFIERYLGVDVHMKKNKHLGIKVGQLEMELKLSPDERELLIRNRYIGISKLLKDKFESEWHKTAWQKDDGFLTFSLCIPDRPVIIKPDVVQKVMHGQTVSAYCSIPLSLKMSISGSELGEYPIIVLSKTWFGEPDEGVIGYSLKSEVLCSPDKLPQSPIYAICTILIENKSSELLSFDRICLRTEYMGLFKSKKMLSPSTSSCKLVYTGKDRMSKINYLNPSGKGLKIIDNPRVKHGQNLLFKSFQTV
jgi:hypothetical protein